MAKFIIETEYPIAFDSPDHLHPHGTKNDNTSNIAFIEDVEKAYGRMVRFMDLGSAGGLLVHDFVRRGHLALGLEGSDYNIKHQRAEWPALFGKNLFTCDISRDYTVFIEEEGEQKPFLCDLISAWEVVEHIHPDRLHIFFANIYKSLRVGGRFIGSINLNPCTDHAIAYHQSHFSKDFWLDELLPQLKGFALQPYPFPLENALREEVALGVSFMINLEKTAL